MRYFVNKTKLNKKEFYELLNNIINQYVDEFFNDDNIKIEEYKYQLENSKKLLDNNEKVVYNGFEFKVENNYGKKKRN